MLPPRSLQLLTLSLGLLVGFGAPPSLADEPAPSADAEGDAEAEDEDEEDRWIAVVGGRVHTVAGPVLRGATVLARNGEIVAIGRDLPVPEGAEVIDATGMRVYPGLVAFDSSGLVGNPAQDGTDVFGLSMTLALSTGITTAGSGPSVVHLTQGTTEDLVLGPNPLVRLDLSSTMARHSLTQDLERVRGYLRESQAYGVAKAQGEEVEEPARDWIRGKFEAYERLLKGEARGFASVNSARDLGRLATLCERYGFSAVAYGGVEAWTMAGRLGRAGVSVVVVPRSRARANQRQAAPSGWTIENAARLHAAGVDVAIMSRGRGIGTWGLAGTDLWTLPLEAAFAVRGGLDPDAALRGITLEPARMLGVDHRVGSLEVGKECDLIVTRGDLLHYTTLVEWAVVDGRIVYDKERDSLLRHIRPRELDEGNFEVPQLWPRQRGEPLPEVPERDW
jgi:Amidohydrolase family